MKRHTVSVGALMLALLVAIAPSFAQRSRDAGGPPPNTGMPPSTSRGPSGGGAPGEGMPSHDAGALSHPDQGTSAMAHSSPSDVLSHNTAISGKISTLTGQNAQAACSGFKNLGECVAAAHVAKNLDIAGGFDALKAKMTGSNAESLSKAIQDLDPHAGAKAEAKKANKQTAEDLKESHS